MPMFKTRSPDKFPMIFHRIVETAWQELHKPDAKKYTEMNWPSNALECLNAVMLKREHRRFDAFRMMVRKATLHPLHEKMEKMHIRVGERVGPGGFYLNFKSSLKPVLGDTFNIVFRDPESPSN